MTTAPERKKHPLEPLTCNCGDRADHFCGKVYPEADANDQLLNLWLKNCALFIAWMLTFLAGLLIGGCR
jgi:hypothetical protein